MSKSARWWDLPAVLLLLLALSVATGRLVATDWVDHLDRIHAVVFLGALVGLALGWSRFSSVIVMTLGLVYGLFVTLWQLGLTLETLPLDALWRERLFLLAARLSVTLGQLMEQEPVKDPILFLSIMMVLYWGLSVHAGYNLTRYARPWRTVLPFGLALLIVHSYDPHVATRSWYVGAYFLFALLAVARIVYLRLRASWQQRDVRVPPLVGWDFTYVIVIAATAIILLAWTVPSLAGTLPHLDEAWRRAIRPWSERFDNIFASLRRRGGILTVADYYGDSFSLGRGRELTDALVLTAQGGDVGGGLRYYWRARVYDHYEDGRWSNEALSATQTVSPVGLGLTFPDLEGRRTFTFTITTHDVVATLYVAAQPRWVDRRVESDLAYNPDGTVDLAAWHATRPLAPGETYRTRSDVSDVTVSQLRAAGSDYPTWVTERYLQLPPTVTSRTQELAQQIALDQETPYDVAVAVTRFLRQSIDYSETITPSIPPDQEPLDWFLFDLRQGFCNYYASAEVIMLRSLGIPARLAVGFAEGERQPGADIYLVRQEQAHAWPEVYFPGVGWVEFEPTASQDPLRRPLGQVDLEGERDDEDVAADRLGDEEDRLDDRMSDLEGMDDIYPDGGLWGLPGLARRIPSPLWLLLIAGLLLMILAWRLRQRQILPPLPILVSRGVRRLGRRPPVWLRRWAARSVMSPMKRAYMTINRALVRLGTPPAPADTPAERAAALSAVLPSAADPIQRLYLEYQIATYSPQSGNVGLAQQAARAIRNRSWKARMRRLFVRNG
jgi:transglutaminase-like putative cysteine protease